MTDTNYDNIDKLKLINKITAILAHEIRNPVSSIAGVAQLIRSDKEVLNNEEQRQKIVGIIERESERLTNLVEEFLIYSGSEKRKNEDLDLSSVMNESCENLKANKEYASKDVTLSFKTKMPVFIIKGDQQRMVQAFDNILINALQASPIKGTISISSKEMVDGIHISVSDTGAGIQEGTESSIFEPFFTTKERGTGLGLAIAKNIIKAHGGDIEVSNSLQGGAVFKMFFPKTIK